MFEVFLKQKFNVEADVYVSKKKKLVHVSFLNPLISYSFFDELVELIEKYRNKRKIFYPRYYFIFPRLNDCLKWRYGYVFLAKDKQKNKKWRLF